MTEMANRSMGLIEYDLDQLPPLDECLPGDANYIPAHLVFSPNEPVLNPEVRVCLWIVKDFHKEWIFMIVSSHEPCEVDVSLYAYA